MLQITIDSDDELTFEEREVTEAIMSHVYAIIKLCLVGTIMVEPNDSDAPTQ